MVKIDDSNLSKLLAKLMVQNRYTSQALWWFRVGVGYRRIVGRSLSSWSESFHTRQSAKIANSQAGNEVGPHALGFAVKRYGLYGQRSLPEHQTLVSQLRSQLHIRSINTVIASLCPRRMIALPFFRELHPMLPSVCSPPLPSLLMEHS